MRSEVYKVVKRRKGGSLMSATTPNSPVVGGLPSAAQVRYAAGETAYPSIPNSKLFAFSSLQAAKQFAGDIAELEVWLAETSAWQPVGPLIPTVLGTSLFSLTTFWVYWANKAWYDMACQKVPPPPGTVLCDDITLIRRVKGD